MAQVSLMNRGQRGPGQFDTASVVVDATVQAAWIQLDPHQNEMASTKQVKVDVYFSDDNGQTWRHAAGFGSQGPWTTRPWWSPGDVSMYHGKRVMARIDLPQQINCGVVLWVNENPDGPSPF